MLDDISAVKTWAKVNEGMIKMYKAEVLDSCIKGDGRLDKLEPFRTRRYGPNGLLVKRNVVEVPFFRALIGGERGGSARVGRRVGCIGDDGLRHGRFGRAVEETGVRL